MRPKAFTIGLTVLLTAGSSGCGQKGPEKYQVSGTVTFAGAPVSNGDIIFIPENTSLAPEAGAIAGGRYSALVKPGKCRVEITALNIGPNTPVIMGSPIAANYIPEKYNRQSELTAEIQPRDGNVFDFPLNR